LHRGTDEGSARLGFYTASTGKLLLAVRRSVGPPYLEAIRFFEMLLIICNLISLKISEHLSLFFLFHCSEWKCPSCWRSSLSTLVCIRISSLRAFCLGWEKISSAFYGASWQAEGTEKLENRITTDIESIAPDMR